MAEQLNRNASSQDFSNPSSQNQQFRKADTTEQSYNSEDQRQVYHSTQQSFNEQRQQYTEQAFNTYDYSDSGERTFTTAVNSIDDSNVLYDSALEKMNRRRNVVIQTEEELYDSIEPAIMTRIVSADRYIEENDSKKKKIHRLVNGKASRRYVTASKDIMNGRLLIQESERRLTKKEFDKKSNKEHIEKYAKDAAVRKVTGKGRLLFDDKTIAEDEDAAAMKRTLKKGVRTGRIVGRESLRKIEKKTNKYARLKNAIDREKLLDEKIKQRLNNLAYKQGLDAVKAEKNKAERNKKMQQTRQQRKEREGNFFRRILHNSKIKKKSVEQKARTAKNIASVVVSVGIIIILFLFVVMFVFVFGMVIFQGTAESYTQTVIQVDYSVMSDCTSYYRKLETDLEEKLLDTESFENEIKAEYGDDIYEFNYIIADISFDSTTLVAYLGAKYVEFTFEDVKSELDELFELNYKIVVETKLEYREIDGTDSKVKICYITLEKTPLEDIVIGRMTEEQLYQYNTYKLSSGGQQVYGPVMKTDWTNLITSNFGERIHPITRERTFHNGVDIGIPTGTPLYSAIDGKVIVATYSDTAGYYVKVQSNSGWTVIFMHMDSLAVSVGDVLKKGDFVGCSGNTGRSTGPHLHLEVRDAGDTPINPIFIIPQTCVYVTSSE